MIPVAPVLFTALFGVLFIWMTVGFLGGKIRLFSCYGLLYLLVAMRLAALALDIVASYTTANLGYRIAVSSPALGGLKAHVFHSSTACLSNLTAS
jgi:hypothetical protein